MALIPYQTPTGTIDGVNKTFTASTTIYQFDSILVDGADYTTAPVINGSSFTLADAPTVSIEIQFYDTNPALSTTVTGNNTLLTNRGNVRTRLKIDPQKKIWSDDTLDRYINEGQRWLLNDPTLNWEFQETVGYLLPVLDYQEYRSSTDTYPETYMTTKLKKFIRGQTETGSNISFGKLPSYGTGASSAASMLTAYGQRYFLNTGYDSATTYTTLHNMDSYDGDGTWVASNDATSVSTNTTDQKEGTGCVSFNVDVSGSSNNKATITNPDMTPVTLSDSIENGGLIMWVYFPTVVYMKSLEVKFGLDSSNYYAAKQYEVDVQGMKYSAGWNRIFLQTKNKQTIGEPTTSIGYLQVTVEFDSGQTDFTSFLVDNIQFCNKYIQYWYSRKAVDLNTDSSESIVPNQYQFIYELYAEFKALSQIAGREAQAKLRLDEANMNRNIMIEELQYNVPQDFTMPPR